MIIGKSRDKILLPELPSSVNMTADPSKVILQNEILSNLESIAKKYEKGVKQRAKAYAEDTVKGVFESDEELMKQAEESLGELYDDKKRKATDRFLKNDEELRVKQEDLQNDRTQALDRIAQDYDAKESRLAENLSRRGIAHSSIADLSNAGLSAERAEMQESTNALYDKRLGAVEEKIKLVTATYENALKNYEISYALELEKQLNTLIKKRDKMQSEYVKQHADDKEKAYYDYINDDKQRNRVYEESEGDYFGAKKENYQERYDYLIEALAGKNKGSIQNFIKQNESDLRAYLGLYYDRFVKEVS